MRKLAPLASSTLAPSPIFTFAATAVLPSPISTSISSSSSTRWVRRLHHIQRNYRERNLLFNRMVQAGVNSSNDSSGSQDTNENNTSIISTTTQINSSTSSTTNSQLQDDEQSIRTRSKAVCKLNCTYCESRAMLLADTRVELYSTDVPPLSVQLVGEDYLTQNCHCKIRDVACLTCGNVLGYHITQPCQQCMDACNNGHLWMFHTEEVTSEERLDFNAEDDVEIVDTVEDEYEQ
ncbi:3001_t:CDS:2, partial [Scutellospora calospora]